MARILKNSGNTKITIDNKPIDSGGEGAVYRIIAPKSFANQCVKIYHNAQLHRRESKIKFMIANPPHKLWDSSYLICWPTDLVYENKRFAGFMMPLAFAESIQLYEFTIPRIRPSMQKKWGRKFDRSTKQGIATRLKLCVNIAIAVHSIHSFSNYIFVDLKPQNMLVSTDGKISMIDLDSIQINQGTKVVFSGPVTTPGYAPPERVNSIEKSWDEFSLAVVFYQVLFGLHPYAASANGQYQQLNTIGEKISSGLFVHGQKSRHICNESELHNNFHVIPKSLQNLFLTAFDNNPKGRPSAEIWGKTIFNELQEGQVHEIQPLPPLQKHVRQPAKTSFPPPTAKPTIRQKKSSSSVQIGLLSLLAGLAIGILSLLLGTIGADLVIGLLQGWGIPNVPLIYFSLGTIAILCFISFRFVRSKLGKKVNSLFSIGTFAVWLFIGYYFFFTLPIIKFSDGTTLRGIESLYYVGFREQLFRTVQIILRL